MATTVPDSSPAKAFLRRAVSFTLCRTPGCRNNLSLADPKSLSGPANKSQEKRSKTPPLRREALESRATRPTFIFEAVL